LKLYGIVMFTLCLDLFLTKMRQTIELQTVQIKANIHEGHNAYQHRAEMLQIVDKTVHDSAFQVNLVILLKSCSSDP